MPRKLRRILFCLLISINVAIVAIAILVSNTSLRPVSLGLLDFVNLEE